MAKHTTNISKRLAIGLMAAFGLSTGWAASSEAAPVTFNFTGSFRHDGFDIPVSGHYTFESTAPDLITEDNFGSYYAPGGAPYGFEVTVRGQTIAGSDSLGIAVLNNVNRYDAYHVFACGGGAGCPTSLVLLMDDLHATVFGSDALPVVAPSLGAFEEQRFELRGLVAGSPIDVSGRITSLTCATCDPDPDPDPTPVPEPGTLLLLTPGLAFLARVRRRIESARARRLAIGLMAVMACSTGWAASSEAAPMTYSFTGYITRTNYYDFGDPFNGDVVVGTTFSGSYTFDSVGQPEQVGGLTRYNWAGLPYQMNVTMGGHSFLASDLAGVGVYNDYFGEDQYGAAACTGSQCQGSYMQIRMRDYDGIALSDAGIPLHVPSVFSEFEERWFDMRGAFIGPRQEWAVAGRLTSLTCTQGGGACEFDPVPATVPEPRTLLLLTSGLAYLVRRQSSLRIRPSSPISRWTRAKATR